MDDKKEKDSPSPLCLLFVLLSVCVTSVRTIDIPDDVIFLTTGKDLLMWEGTTDWLSNHRNLSMNTISSGVFDQNVGVSYHYHRGVLLLSAAGTHSILMFQDGSPQGVVFHIGTSTGVGHICVDWVNNNVYWVDVLYGWIVMKVLTADLASHQSLDPNFKVVVDKYLDQPSGIAVHPQKYYLFWSDIGSEPKIERSNLVGGARTVLVWQGLISPASLTVDQSSDRLYWTDQTRWTVEYIDFNGGGRTILTTREGNAFYGIDVFQGYLLVTTPLENRTSVYESTSGRGLKDLVYRYNPVYSVVVYSEEKQPRAPAVACESSFFNCSSICVDQEDDAGASCLCGDGYALEADGLTCTAASGVLQRLILFTDGSRICSLSVTYLHSYTHVGLIKYDCGVVNYSSSILRFAVDAHSNTIFFTDGSSIYKQVAFSSSRQTLYQGSGGIADMDYNWKTQAVLWTEPERNKILSVSGNTPASETGEVIEVASAAEKATKLAVDPYDRRIFWISEAGTRPALYSMSDTGDVSRLQTQNLLQPTDLEYDRQHHRLVWSDSGGYVGTINTDGSAERKLQEGSTAEHYQALTVFKKFFILTSIRESLPVLNVLVDADPVSGFSMDGLAESFHEITDIHVVSSSLQPTDLEPCEQDNGGCDHVCIPEETQHCACNLGYRLNEDGKTCSTSSMTSNFFLVTDEFFGKILQIDNIRGTINAVDIHENNGPRAAIFDDTRSRFLWIDQVTKSIKTKRLGEATEISFGTDVAATSHLAVDSSSGNVYVTVGSKILLVTDSGVTKTVISNTQGTPGKIALVPEEGIMVWIETGSVTRIVKAFMDGLGQKEVASSDLESPEDLAVDYDDNFVYWCDSSSRKISRVSLTSLNREDVYSTIDLEPVSLDVLGEHVYFIGKGLRFISRVNKRTGSDYIRVFESALVGRLASLYLWKNPPQGNAACDPCSNGGCSTVCLPGSTGRTCHCQDGIALKADGRTCSNVERCPLTIEGVKWDGCCIAVSGSDCSFTCATGSVGSATAAECLSNGRWNVTENNMCIEDDSQPGGDAQADDKQSQTTVAIAAGAGAGGAVLIIVIVVVVIVCRRRRKRKEALRAQYINPMLPEDETANLGQASGGGKGKDEDHYDYLSSKDVEVVQPRRESTKSERYPPLPIRAPSAGFEAVNNGGYNRSSAKSGSGGSWNTGLEEPAVDYHGYLQLDSSGPLPAFPVDRWQYPDGSMASRGLRRPGAHEPEGRDGYLTSTSLRGSGALPLADMRRVSEREHEDGYITASQKSRQRNVDRFT